MADETSYVSISEDKEKPGHQQTRFSTHLLMLLLVLISIVSIVLCFEMYKLQQENAEIVKVVETMASSGLNESYDVDAYTDSDRDRPQTEDIVWCDLCHDYDWVFILGTGRSGSTTILSMINSIPGFYLAGENGKAIEILYTLPFFGGNSRKEELVGTEVNPRGPYKHKHVNKDALHCTIQRYFRDIIGHSKNGKKFGVIGFKEIQVTNPEILDFMREAFPCARFVVNYRKDLKAQKRSKFQREVPISRLRRHTNSLLDWAKDNGDRTFILPLEDFSIPLFNKLLNWLGVSDCSYDSMLHANKGGYKDDVNAEMTGNCTYIRPTFDVNIDSTKAIL